MIVRFIEVTNGPQNWGKFLVAQFDSTEWRRLSAVDGTSLLSNRGWTKDHVLVFDLQTGEGALFRHGGHARYDLEKHRIWVCPLFEPFLEWLYKQPDPLELPEHVNLPNAPFAMSGHRRLGSEREVEKKIWEKARELTEEAARKDEGIALQASEDFDALSADDASVYRFAARRLRLLASVFEEEAKKVST